MRPVRLANGSTRQKFLHDRLDIQHGGTIDSVQAFDVQAATFAAQDAHNGQTQPVRAQPATLGKDAYQRPVRVLTRATRTWNDIPITHKMESIDDLGM